MKESSEALWTIRSEGLEAGERWSLGTVESLHGLGLIVDGADANNGTPVFKYDREENGKAREMGLECQKYEGNLRRKCCLTKGGSFKRKELGGWTSQGYQPVRMVF